MVQGGWRILLTSKTGQIQFGVPQFILVVESVLAFSGAARIDGVVRWLS